MALSRGSLYKAFKDKRSVFLAAYERYTSANQARLQQAIEQADSGRARVLAVLNTYALRASDENGRMGCLVLATAINLTTLDAEIASRVSASLDRSKKLLTRLLTEGKADGSVNARVDERATAELLVCLVQGMRVLGKTSPRRTVMNRVVAEAMKLLD
jgi:AcrR family transcriptional regulator